MLFKYYPACVAGAVLSNVKRWWQVQQTTRWVYFFLTVQIAGYVLLLRYFKFQLLSY